VVAPALNVLPKNLAEPLLEYVRNGGFLVLGPRSGMKDDANGLLPQRQPGYLADALGGRVEQYYALDIDLPVTGMVGSGQASIWAEQLKTTASDTEVVLTYGASNGWLDDQPAVISRQYGKGRISYIGAILDDKLMDAAGELMIKESGAAWSAISVPEGVEVSRRTGPAGPVFILINFTRAAQHVDLHHTMKSLLGQKQVSALDLPAYGVELLVDVK